MTTDNNLDNSDSSEENFIKSYDITKYDRPSVTADIVVFGVLNEPSGNYRKPNKPEMCVLLIQRKSHPFKGMWALPGGFLNKNESIEACAARELWEETNLEINKFWSIGTFSKPGRDPRGWIISCALLGIAKPSNQKAVAGDDASEAIWTPINNVLSEDFEIAFDHKEIIIKALERLRLENVDQIAFEFLNNDFTISELQFVHEFIEDRPLLGPNFRRKMKTLIEESHSIDKHLDDEDILCACIDNSLAKSKKISGKVCCEKRIHIEPEKTTMSKKVPVMACMEPRISESRKSISSMRPLDLPHSMCHRPTSYNCKKISLNKEDGVGHRPATYFKRKKDI